MTKQQFRSLCEQRIVRLDGATGTELAKKGMPAGVCPEFWCLNNPAAVRELHRAYFDAGADIVITPTFGCNEIKLAEFNLADETVKLNEAIAANAKNNGNQGFVFGDIGPTGKIVEPFGDLDFEYAVKVFQKQALTLLKGGVDGFSIETMMDLQEARAALIAVREVAPDLPIQVSITVEDGGKSLTGTDPVAALIALQALGADAVGLNCSTGPDEMAQVIQNMKPYAAVPLLAKPNAGIPRLVNGKTIFDLSPNVFAEKSSQLARIGANIIGGCCGTTPAHIAELNRKLVNIKPIPVKKEKSGVVSSSSRIFHFFQSGKFGLIGERINPTGKKLLQAELREGKFEIVRRFATEQTAAGANLLDVNFGMPSVNECELMGQGIKEIIRVSPLPVCIDTTSPEVAEKALRLYPGRALFNSISAENKRVTELLPVVAKYGAMPILLPINDDGVPETAIARNAIISPLIEAVARYGYTTDDLLVDALVMTISANPLAAVETLNFIRGCSARGWNTVCGLSNVSFGLPNRQILNSAFLGVAVGNGLSAAIANPSASAIKNSVLAFNALLGKDDKLQNYLAAATTIAPTTKDTPAIDTKIEKKPEEKVFDAVINGDNDAITSEVKSALNFGVAASDLVKNVLIPAITVVGEKFEKKEYFLPQLLRSAEAMQTAMKVLEPLLLEKNEQSDSAPVFILATVQGDIHDIGKNIVALLLKNHNFNVIDLGKNVPAEQIVENVKKYHADFLGLSALMTTTMPKMKEVIALLRAENLTIPVIVGGAAVDDGFAKEIGAVYAADAMETVRKAQAMLR